MIILKKTRDLKIFFCVYHIGCLNYYFFGITHSASGYEKEIIVFI